MKTYAYIGSRTTRQRHARGEGISVYEVDPDDGSLRLVQILGDLVNPSFLAINRRGDRLYAVHGDMHELSEFEVDGQTGKLIFVSQQSTHGKNPVHLALDPDDRHLIVSNHLGGSLAVLPLAEDGGLQAMTQLTSLQGETGPHRIEQQHAKPHFNPFDPSGRFVVVPDKGLDRIFVFRFEQGRLELVSSVSSREGSGPRHVAFHPRLPMAYCVNELNSTVTCYRFDPEAGILSPLQILPTLPDTCTGDSRAAAIEVDDHGRFLYASNRGHDSIAVFAVDPASGLLTFMEACPSGGRTPRFTTLSPDGRHFYALNEDSDSIVVFEVGKETGRLVPTGEATTCGSPVCMVFSGKRTG